LARGITVQLDVPLQDRVLHWSSEQVIAVPTHEPAALHVSLKVQPLLSLHAVPVSGVTVQVDVPLQALVLHWSLVQVTVVPPQTPLVQTSLKVHALPSSQAVPFGWPLHVKEPTVTSLRTGVVVLTVVSSSALYFR
jgi:hypothetical protein